MKLSAGLLVASVFGLLMYVTPAHAQFANLPNQAAWNQYLANHPKTAAELEANPSLMYNSKWRAQHPHFDQWINNHPKDWETMRSRGPWQNRYGAWDRDEWHDQDWWYHHNPQWTHENHPDWWESHKDWKAWQKEERHEQVEHAEQQRQHHNHNHDNDHD